MKAFGPGDITLHTSIVHSTIKVSDDHSDIQIIHYDSASNNETSQSYYNSLYHLLYDTSYEPSSSAGQFYGNWRNQNYESYVYPRDGLEQHRNRFGSNGILINISSSLYGSGIESGSFTMEFNLTGSFSGSRTAKVLDDGQGNLYLSESLIRQTGSNYSTTNPAINTSGSIVSQSSDTPISSSENYIGNIFYEDGLVVITETGSFFTSSMEPEEKYFSSSIYSSSIEFNSTDTIFTKQYYCKIKRSEYNWTTNKTILVSSSSLRSASVPDYVYWDINDIPYPEHRFKKNRDQYRIAEWREMDDTIIDKKFKHKEFTPYISKIGLYNEHQELLMVATFPTPIKKSKLSDMTIIVQYDY